MSAPVLPAQTLVDQIALTLIALMSRERKETEFRAQLYASPCSYLIQNFHMLLSTTVEMKLKLKLNQQFTLIV